MYSSKLGQACVLFSLAITVISVSITAASCRRASSPAPAASQVSSDTWAVVDGRAITREDVEKAYRRMADPARPLADEEAMAAKLSLLNDLILQDILLAKAKTMKVEVAEKDLDQAYAEAKQNVPDDAFVQELTKRNLTPVDMREGLRRQLLSQKVVDQEIGSKVNVTDQEVTDFFAANKADFNLPEDSVHIAQIVITPTREAQRTNRTGDDATTPQTAATKAQMLMERLKSGASFGDLAMDYSEDAESAARGGDLGLVPMSRLKQAPAPLRDAVLQVPPGNARLVSAGGGHTIVMVIAREPAGQRDLTMPAVRDRIAETLRGRKEQLMRAAYLTSVQNDADVVNHLARRIVETQGKLPK